MALTTLKSISKFFLLYFQTQSPSIHRDDKTTCGWCNKVKIVTVSERSRHCCYWIRPFAADRSCNVIELGVVSAELQKHRRTGRGRVAAPPPTSFGNCEFFRVKRLEEHVLKGFKAYRLLSLTFALPELKGLLKRMVEWGIQVFCFGRATCRLSFKCGYHFHSQFWQMTKYQKEPNKRFNEQNNRCVRVLLQEREMTFAPSTCIQIFLNPQLFLSPSTRSVLKSNSPVHAHPMVSGFTLEKLGLHVVPPYWFIVR